MGIVIEFILTSVLNVKCNLLSCSECVLSLAEVREINVCRCMS